jgi:multiple sugar transport system ATP-binding protein
MASVRFDHVTKRYGDVVAVDALTLHIADKEFLALVGPSGCGKSTVLRLLAGLEEPTEGSIYIGERLVNNVPARDRNVAMVFQDYALYPHMTVFDNIAFTLKARGVQKPEIMDRVQRVAEDLGIAYLFERKPEQLSAAGGQRQRTAVGRAMVREPDVFLMDEPLSNLDPGMRVKARTLLSTLHRALETTLVYVTHNQMEAMTLGSRIAVQRDGVLEQVDTPENLYDYPANLFVAGFIGSPSMNFFGVTLVGTEREMHVDGGTFKLRLPAGKVGPLASYLGKDVVFGVRPEDIHDAQFAPPGLAEASVSGKVDVTQFMGKDILVHLLTGEKSFVARVDRRTQTQIGADIDVVIDMEHAHFFDRQTEEAIR